MRARLLPVFLGLLTSVQAQIPTPESFLGYKVGADYKLADFQTVSKYFEKLDAASPRMVIRQIGKSTEGRAMFVAEISSEKNIRDLDRLLGLNAKLHDPRKIKDAAERARLLKDAKTTVLLNCSMHASEVAAAQMSMELAYNLVSGNDAGTKDILDNCIIQLVACANPDGLDLVKGWYDKNLGTKFEDAPMPYLYQKYIGHDNNRDWWLISQAETVNVTKYLYGRAYPTVLYDIHQMGSNGARLFVPPFFDPVNPNIDPIISQGILLLGAHMASDLAAANKQGVLYSAIYDNWWQGGMRTTPQRHNIVAILTEAASVKTATPIDIKPSQLRGHDRGLPTYETRVNFPDPWPGGMWRLRDIVDYELIAVNSMLRVSSRYRDAWVRNQLAMSEKQIALGENEAPRAWIVPANQPNQAGVQQLLRSLMIAGVEVHQATSEFGVGELTYPVGTYVLKANQPYRAHLKDLMERQNYPIRREYPSGPVDRPYDVAGWSAPLVLGVESLQVGIKFTASLNRLTEVPIVKPSNPLGSLNPRLALYQPWTASMDEGWTRWVWEQHGVPYKTLHNSDIQAGRLREAFDCIFLPGQSADSIINGVSAERTPAPFGGGMGASGLAELKQFVEDGGTLVLMDESWSLAKTLGIDGITSALAGIGREKFYCPGSVLRTIAADHPMVAGMERYGIAYFSNSEAFNVADNPNIEVLARYADKDVLLSGFLLGEEFVKGKACALECKLGKGRVEIFGFPVQHRGQTMATFPYMWNAMKRSVKP